MLILKEMGLSIKLAEGAQCWEILCDFNILLKKAKLTKRGHLKD